MGSHRLVHPPQTSAEPTGSGTTHTEHREGRDISINAWRIVVILAILAAVAAAVLFTIGVTADHASAQSFRELDLTTLLEPVV
jgi:anti-sigma-K factor RskA